MKKYIFLCGISFIACGVLPSDSIDVKGSGAASADGESAWMSAGLVNLCKSFDEFVAVADSGNVMPILDALVFVHHVLGEVVPEEESLLPPLDECYSALRQFTQEYQKGYGVRPTNDDLLRELGNGIEEALSEGDNNFLVGALVIIREWAHQGKASKRMSMCLLEKLIEKSDWEKCKSFAQAVLDEVKRVSAGK